MPKPTLKVEPWGKKKKKKEKKKKKKEKTTAPAQESATVPLSWAEIVLIWDNNGIAIANNAIKVKACIRGKPEVLDVCLPIKTQSLETSRFLIYLKTNCSRLYNGRTRKITMYSEHDF